MSSGSYESMLSMMPLFDEHWHFQSVISRRSPSPNSASSSSNSASSSSNSASSSSSSLAAARFSEEEEFYRVFQAFDANGDGLMSKEEVCSLMSKLGHNLSPEDADLLMLTMDTNGDGFLDFPEFLSLYRECGIGTDFASSSGSEEDDSEETLREAFRVFDKDGDGLITLEELHGVLSSLGLVQGSMSVDACRRMIEVVDSNGDGFVDFDEFKGMMSRPLYLQ